MFEDLLTPPARFIVGENYRCRGRGHYATPAFYHNLIVERRTDKTVWVRYAGDPERLRQKRIRRDGEGNEFITELVEIPGEREGERWIIHSTDKETVNYG